MALSFIAASAVRAAARTNALELVENTEFEVIDYPFWPLQVSVAAGQTGATVAGSVAGIGDVLGKLDYVVNTPGATATLSVQDGNGTVYTLHPTGGFTTAGPGSVILDYTSVSGAWKVTTGAGLTAVASLL